MKEYVSGAYSPCMRSMHCMPSDFAKKDNNNLNKCILKFKTKSIYVATVTGIYFQVKVAINNLAYFIHFSFSPFSAYR